MVNVFLVLGLVAAISAVPHKSVKSHIFSRENIDFVDYGNCDTKDNGDYPHPTDCTRFITCSNKLASDMACADCDTNNAQCDGGLYLRFDAALERCEWPINTPCDPDPVDGQTTPDAGDDETFVCNGTEVVVGQECGKNDCDRCGFCIDMRNFFLRCERTKPSDPKEDWVGVVVLEECDKELWWNPFSAPNYWGLGGACDKWENLDEEVQNVYKEDTTCYVEERVCEWGQDDADKCSGNYWYLGPEADAVKVPYTCGDGLLWDQASETCRTSVDGCGKKTAVKSH